MSQDQEYVKLKCIETQTLENMTRCSLLITNYTLTIEYDKLKIVHNTGGSSNGRTADSDSANGGSNPPPPANND